MDLSLECLFQVGWVGFVILAAGIFRYLVFGLSLQSWWSEGPGHGQCSPGLVWREVQ
jgi:hypothetical protein